MKDWFPQKQYLKQLGIAHEDYPEEVRFQVLVLELDLLKRCRRELIRREENVFNSKKRQILRRDILMFNIG